MCKALSVDEEAYFDGTSQRVNDPLGLEESQSRPAQSGLAKPVISTSKPDTVKDTVKDTAKDKGEKLQPLAASASHGH